MDRMHHVLSINLGVGVQGSFFFDGCYWGRGRDTCNPYLVVMFSKIVDWRAGRDTCSPYQSLFIPPLLIGWRLVLELVLAGSSLPGRGRDRVCRSR